MEQGKIEEAEAMKPLLEAKQRQNITKKVFGGMQLFI